MTKYAYNSALLETFGFGADFAWPFVARPLSGRRSRVLVKFGGSWALSG
jgi:hypothetical protein